MKKSYLLATTMVLALSGCTGSSSDTTEQSENAVEVSTEEPTEEPAEETETVSDEVSEAQILFNGSSTLGPVIAKIAQDFNEEYGSWNQVNSEFPDEDISIYVAVGGSGQGSKSVIEGTADFGMLARQVKDSEKEAIADYYEYLVGIDALSIAVNPESPILGITDDLTKDEVTKIFSGEYATWQDFDSSLPADEIVVVTRDIGGGAHSVFQDNVMGDVEVKVDAIQSPTMGALVTKIAENKNAIGYASFGVAQQNAGSINMLKLDGIEANVENILDGSYILQRPLLLIMDGEPNSHQQAFLDVVLGETGQTTVEDMGFIPAN